jgi:serine protease
VRTSGGSGDADLYVRFGGEPTETTYDYRPYKNGNNETVNVTKAQGGDWYVGIRGYNSYANVELEASY